MSRCTINNAENDFISLFVAYYSVFKLALKVRSYISRASIDACKDYYRDDLQKTDWQLMIELKKIFGIM